MRSMRSTEAKRGHWPKGAAIAAVASLLLLVAGQVLAQAANSIEGLTVSKGNSGRPIGRVPLRAPLPNPPGGCPDNHPPRPAPELPDGGNGQGRRSHTGKAGPGARCASRTSSRRLGGWWAGGR